MICAALTLLVFAAASVAPEEYLTQEYVDSLNAKGLPWRAELPRGIRLAHATLSDVKGLMGVKSKGGRLPRQTYPAEAANAVPASFEAQSKWPQCPSITTIRDQSACGSCWAIAAAEAITDRYCTFGVHKNLPISAANLMECCWYCGNGCNGGDPSAAWQFWVSKGLLTNECQPYPFPKCEHHISGGQYPPCPSQIYPTPPCSRRCNTSGTQPTYYKGERTYGLMGESDYMTEVYNNGPIEVAFSVYKDFLTYSGGVYVRKSDDYLGGHAVRLVGWGTLNGVPYWKIANSWNSDWGMNGYFLIKRGVDECGIETSGVAGVPAKN